MNKVMVIAVHPDDETLGCGGTLFKYKEMGAEIHWVIVTDARSFPGITEQKLAERRGVIDKVAKLYQFNSVTELNFPTIELDTLNKKKIIDAFSRVISEIKPDTLYLPFAYDVHSDHRISFECAYSCTKIFRYPFVRKVLMMETLSETEFAPSLVTTSFIPNVFHDITKFMEKKLNTLNVYKSEIGEHPFPRSVDSVKAQGLIRGASSGCEYAEAFMLLKEIN